jgi:hypothetical protein
VPIISPSAPRPTAFFESHICWNDPNELRMEPPIQTPNFRSNAAGATIFALKGAHRLRATSECKRSAVPGAHEPPPDRTMLSSKSFRTSTSTRSNEPLTISGKAATTGSLIGGWICGGWSARCPTLASRTTLIEGSSSSFLTTSSSSTPSNSCSGARTRSVVTSTTVPSGKKNWRLSSLSPTARPHFFGMTP